MCKSIEVTDFSHIFPTLCHADELLAELNCWPCSKRGRGVKANKTRGVDSKILLFFSGREGFHGGNFMQKVSSCEPLYGSL